MSVEYFFRKQQTMSVNASNPGSRAIATPQATPKLSTKSQHSPFESPTRRSDSTPLSKYTILPDTHTRSISPRTSTFQISSHDTFFLNDCCTAENDVGGGEDRAVSRDEIAGVGWDEGLLGVVDGRERVGWHLWEWMNFRGDSRASAEWIDEVIVMDAEKGRSGCNRGVRRDFFWFEIVSKYLQVFIKRSIES